MNNQTLSSLKLAGLRATGVVRAAARDSRLVRWSMKADLLRQQFKSRCKHFFAPKRPAKTNRLRILVHIRGGIGDVVMTRPFMRVLRVHLPQAEISFCYDSSAVVNMVFPDLIDRYQPTAYRPQDYDLVIAGCHFLFFTHYDKNRLAQLAPAFLPILEEGLSVQACFKPFDLYTPYLDGQLAEIAISLGGNRIMNLGWSTGLPVSHADMTPIPLEAAATQQALAKMGLAGKKYITIHDGINVHTDTSSGHPTRCWPEAHWRTFARAFKAQFPDVLLVQLGGNKSHVFDFADISLVGKSAVQDLPHILKHAMLHVDGESGMAHLASAMQTPCVVLFGPSRPEYLAYRGNTSIVSPKCCGCMNISAHWMTTCILGFPYAQQCMAAITPDTVLQAVVSYLKK